MKYIYFLTNIHTNSINQGFDIDFAAYIINQMKSNPTTLAFYSMAVCHAFYVYYWFFVNAFRHAASKYKFK